MGRKRERERKSNIDERGEYQLVASRMYPDQKLNMQPRHVPWLGFELATFHFVGCLSTHWATAVRAKDALLLSFSFSSIIPHYTEETALMITLLTSHPTLPLPSFWQMPTMPLVQATGSQGAPLPPRFPWRPHQAFFSSCSPGFFPRSQHHLKPTLLQKEIFPL